MHVEGIWALIYIGSTIGGAIGIYFLIKHIWKRTKPAE